MTHNPQTQPMQCHYALSKEYNNTVTTDIAVESPHFPIYLQIKEDYFKVQPENNLYLPLSYHEYKTKAQPLELVHYHKKQQLKQGNSHLETYPIVKQTDVTLNTNETEPFTPDTQKANDADSINSIKFSLPAMDDFIPKSPEIFSYFFDKQTEVTDTFLQETQQKYSVLRQLLFCKKKQKPLLSPFVNSPSNQGTATLL